MCDSHSNEQVTRYIGIDVASDSCVAAIDGRRPRKFSRTAAGARELASWVRRIYKDSRLKAVMEHTGAYSRSWESLLAGQEIDSVLVDPRRVRHLASSDGVRSKTDAIDAKAILAYAKHYNPEPRVVRSAAELQLSKLLNQRGLLVGQRVAVRNQLASVELMQVCASMDNSPIQRVLDALDLSIAEIDARIDQLMDEDTAMKRARLILGSVPGIGRLNCAGFCSRLSVIMDCSEKELTSMCGMAANHRQSGKKFINRGIDKQGWNMLRRNLFLAALAASRGSNVFSEFGQRLILRGKPKKLAAVAVARKILVIAHALLHKDEMFNSDFKTT